MILTGQRRGEVAGLDWSELRREGSRWDLPAERSKNGRPHLVPLGKQAIALLDVVGGGKDWPSHGLVFLSSYGTRLSAFSKVKKKWDAMISRKMRSAEEGAVLAPWRIHDIRRTVATGMQALQVRTETSRRFSIISPARRAALSACINATRIRRRSAKR
jgi:integrase